MTTAVYGDGTFERTVFVTSAEVDGFSPYVIYRGRGDGSGNDYETPRRFEWAPDSHELGVSTLGHLCLYLVATSNYSRCFNDIEVYDFDISASGSVAFTDLPGHIWVFAYDDPNAQVRMQLSDEPINWNLEWSPDGSILAFTRMGEIKIVDIYGDETLIAPVPVP